MPNTEDILQLIRDTSTLRGEITSSSDFVTELGIDGDDAEELIEAINSKYPLPINKMNWQRHFHSEAELLSKCYFPKFLAYKVGIRKSPPLRTIEPLSVEKLMEFYNAPP
jgi:hypothetical protein